MYIFIMILCNIFIRSVKLKHIKIKNKYSMMLLKIWIYLLMKMILKKINNKHNQQKLINY